MDDYINAKGKQLEGTVNSEIPSYKCNMSIHTNRNLFVFYCSMYCNILLAQCRKRRLLLSWARNDYINAWSTIGF